MRAAGLSCARQSSSARSRSSLPLESRSRNRSTNSCGMTRSVRSAANRSMMYPSVTIEQMASGHSIGLAVQNSRSTLVPSTAPFPLELAASRLPRPGAAVVFAGGFFALGALGGSAKPGVSFAGSPRGGRSLTTASWPRADDGFATATAVVRPSTTSASADSLPTIAVHPSGKRPQHLIPRSCPLPSAARRLTPSWRRSKASGRGASCRPARRDARARAVWSR